MTNWLVGQTDRFRAAVSANGVSNQVSAAANCDLGVLWTPRLGWSCPPDDVERLWAQSPLAYADRIHTPLLLLQGEADLRCPAADNEQLFSGAPGSRGREVEYVLYPEESHVMQSIGRPDRRIDMLERTLGLARAASAAGVGPLGPRLAGVEPLVVQIEDAYAEVERGLSDPAAAERPAKLRELGRRHKRLSEAHALARRWRELNGSLEEARPCSPRARPTRRCGPTSRARSRRPRRRCRRSRRSSAPRCSSPIPTTGAT